MSTKQVETMNSLRNFQLMLLLVALTQLIAILRGLSSFNRAGLSESSSRRREWRIAQLVKREYLAVKQTQIEENLSWNVFDEPKSFSSSHCFGSWMQKDAWITTGCLLKNVCFNRTSRAFTYYRDPKSSDPGPEAVSKTVVNYRWGTMYHSSIRFHPLVVDEPLPRMRWQTSKNELYVVHLPHVPHNPGHLLWDDYWTWYMLVAASTSLRESTEKEIRPLWLNVNDNPPWATCDWVRIHSGPGHKLKAEKAAECETINRKWLGAFLGEGHTHLSETNWWLANRTDLDDKSDTICLSHVVWGSGSTSRNMGGHDGWNPEDGFPPTAGRGPLIESLRTHMMRRAGLRDVDSHRELLVFIAQFSSKRLSWDMEFQLKAIQESLSELESLARLVTNQAHLKIRIQVAPLWRLSAMEQLNVMSHTAVYIGTAGGGAMSAQFLPPGAGLLLFHRPQDHQGKDDWKIFNMYSPIRTTFIGFEHRFNKDLFLKLLRVEIAACSSFMRFSDE